MPSVSVIIPYYRKINYIKKTINSVLNQTFQDFEIILIYDDENYDDLIYLKKIIKKNKNVKIVLNKKNIGVGLARNKGIKNSKGKYIAFCDADDLWNKKKLQYQLYIMKKFNLSLSHTSYNIINSTDKKIGEMIVEKILNYSDLVKSCDIGLSTIIIKSEIAKKNLFSNMKTKEDYVLWLKLAKKGIKFYGINKKLSSWRKTKNSLSSNLTQKLKDAFMLYNKKENYNKLMSLYFTIRLSVYFLIKKFKQLQIK